MEAIDNFSIEEIEQQLTEAINKIPRKIKRRGRILWEGEIDEISFKAGQEYALSKEGHEAISYLEGHQEGEKQGRKEVVDKFSKWFSEQSWDINGGAYIIPKIVLDRKLMMLKEPFKPSSKNGDYELLLLVQRRVKNDRS